jgi:tetratricopeptide (TPR) repeat protein
MIRASMRPPFGRRIPLLLVAAASALPPAASPAAPSAGDLARLQTARNVGLASLEEGNLAEAGKRFDDVRRLAPAEPLGWANGAVAAMRGKDLASAGKLLSEASRLAPADPRVAALAGVLAEQNGKIDAAIEAYERAASGDPKDLPSRWSIARLLAEKPGARPRAIRALEEALEQAPANLFLLLRLSELRRAEGDRAGAEAALEKAVQESGGADAGDDKLERYAAEAKAAFAAGDLTAAALKSRVVENLLRTSARYQQSRHDVEPGVLGLPLEDWTPALAERIRARPAAIPVRFVARKDEALVSLSDLADVRVSGAESRDLAFAGAAGVVVARSAESLRPGAPIPGSRGARTLEVADVGNSGQLDVIVPGALLRSGPGGWDRSALPSGERIVPLDVDSDGDLDLYLVSPSGDRLLRNNLDGTFADVTASALPAGTASRAAAVADFDRDGDPDLALAKPGGGLRLLDNRRGGRLAERPANLPSAGAVTAVAAGDLDGDGRPDLVWASEGAAAVARNRGDGTFASPQTIASGGVPLLFDFDNDGALDLLLASPGGSTLWRNGGSGDFTRVDADLPAAVAAEAADLDGDGDLDLVFVTPAGRAELRTNEGGNANGWMDVALEGLATGSAKVNRFGYGSEVEARAGELYVFRTARTPVTRLGLGARRRADVLRILWTNGIPQNALNPPTRTLLREVQQLKGSCPFLYAFDGSRWRFVTDALGRSPAGLLYDGIHQAAADTREWLVVRGRDLAPSGGRLLLDFTEELWEVVYFDLAALRAVDHPSGVEIVSNERMVPPPFPEKSLFTVSRPEVPRATDGSGRDRTPEIAREDGAFLGGFEPTRYQGIVAPHELVLELPRARNARRVMLYLTGWIFYSDTSINVSLSQGEKAERPSPPVLEIPDGRGGWKTAIAAMGYPAGKTKTMPLDLSDVLDRGDPRVRIRTNLEIYWDRIAYTVDEGEAPTVLTPAPLVAARLFARGFSRRVRESPDGPHVFVHDDTEPGPQWADMAGRYTRFGDVEELVAAADDRYVIMKGGDCVRLEFDATGLPPLPPGWTRDYVLELDGWDKDADRNTVAGQTVEPLPFHGMDDARYGDPSQTYPDDAASRRFRETYLTREGGPAEFLDAVRWPRTAPADRHP